MVDVKNPIFEVLLWEQNVDAEPGGKVIFTRSCVITHYRWRGKIVKLDMGVPGHIHTRKLPKLQHKKEKGGKK